MRTSLSSAALAALVAMPTAALALEIAPLQATSSAPARAVSSSAPARTDSPSSSDPQEAGTDYLLELGGIDGESTETPGVEPDEIDVHSEQKASASASSKAGTKGGNVEFEWKVEEGESAPGVEPDEIDVNEEPEEASNDVFIKFDGVEGESTKGNVPGVEPDEIDVAEEPQPLTPDFGILLGGGSENEDDEALTEAQQSAVAEILLQGLQEEGAPAETLSLNYEKIKTTTKKTVKLFGFIPLTAEATVEIDESSEVKVKFPWWAFLATGKDADTLGQQIFSSISNVLKTKHDTVKNAIGNIR